MNCIALGATTRDIPNDSLGKEEAKKSTEARQEANILKHSGDAEEVANLASYIA